MTYVTLYICCFGILGGDLPTVLLMISYCSGPLMEEKKKKKAEMLFWRESLKYLLLAFFKNKFHFKYNLKHWHEANWMESSLP